MPEWATVGMTAARRRGFVEQYVKLCFSREEGSTMNLCKDEIGPKKSERALHGYHVEGSSSVEW